MIIVIGQLWPQSSAFEPVLVLNSESKEVAVRNLQFRSLVPHLSDLEKENIYKKSPILSDS